MRCSRLPGPARQRGHWAWWVAPAAAVAIGWGLWSLSDAPHAEGAAGQASAAGGAGSSDAKVAAASASKAGAASVFGAAGARPLALLPAASAPLSAEELRAEQRQLWQARLERARQALDTYRKDTRYPPESQPLSQHPDQVDPNAPVDEEHPLRGPDGKPIAGVRLQTTQERIFAQGPEGVRFTVAVRDDGGQAQPLRVLRASAREMPRPSVASNFPVVELPFTDDGQGADKQSGDRVFSARLLPSAQGFATLSGGIRVEVFLEYRGQQGMTYFDVFYTPAAPATWAGPMQEALEDGSLVFTLPVNVREAGRYVVSARVDDASGKPFALLSFNDEVGSGAQAFRLTLFGLLVRDGRPAFPLTVRDVEAFLLRPDAFPDRSLMPRLAGKVHTSGSYPVAAFSNAEWDSEERQRYLAELGRDVSQAQARLDDPAGKGP